MRFMLPLQNPLKRSGNPPSPPLKAILGKCFPARTFPQASRKLMEQLCGDSVLLYNGDSKPEESGRSGIGEGEDDVCVSGVRQCINLLDGTRSRVRHVKQEDERKKDGRPQPTRQNASPKIPTGGDAHKPDGTAPGGTDACGTPGAEPGAGR